MLATTYQKNTLSPERVISAPANFHVFFPNGLPSSVRRLFHFAFRPHVFSSRGESKQRKMIFRFSPHPFPLRFLSVVFTNVNPPPKVATFTLHEPIPPPIPAFQAQLSLYFLQFTSQVAPPLVVVFR